MELLFVVLIGVLLGLAGRAALPHRRLLGVLLLPAIGGCAGAILWVALVWLRAPAVLGWPAALLAAALSIVAAAVLLGRARVREDERTFEAVARGA